MLSLYAGHKLINNFIIFVLCKIPEHQCTMCCRSSSTHLELYEQDGKDPSMDTKITKLNLTIFTNKKENRMGLKNNSENITHLNTEVESKFLLI